MADPLGNFTDVVLKRDADGIYDLAIDETARDLATTSGLETAIMCSLFSDRRAAPDEVADPWKRRGWLGNLLATTPGDNYGSGLWLYEQRRGTSDVLVALNAEAQTSLHWMVEENLAQNIDASFTYDPAKRIFSLSVLATDLRGGVSRHAFELWKATARGQLATNA